MTALSETEYLDEAGGWELMGRLQREWLANGHRDVFFWMESIGFQKQVRKTAYEIKSNLVAGVSPSGLLLSGAPACKMKKKKSAPPQKETDDIVVAEAGDLCDRAGAGKIKNKIEHFWAKKGATVNPKLVDAGFVPSMRSARTDVESDMVGGLPKNYKGPRVVVKDGIGELQMTAPVARKAPAYKPAAKPAAPAEEIAPPAKPTKSRIAQRMDAARAKGLIP
jgi:hypothetical protein